MSNNRGTALFTVLVIFILCFRKHMDEPLAVLFTSFSNRADKLEVYTNTIRNWAAFLPHIQPVLFTTFEKGPVIDIAFSYGWYVYPNPVTNRYGCPVFKEMYKEAFRRFNASFYGFANGDILFDYGLNDTLNRLREKEKLIKVPLLFGIRWNHNITTSGNDHVTDVASFWKPRTVTHLANPQYSKLFRHDAFDYFFVTRSYPFDKVLPLVISRGGFDTYIVAMANIWHLATIEGTNTVLALHQTDQDGNMAHKALPNNEMNMMYNRHILRKFSYKAGRAENAMYGTETTVNGSVYFKCRRCPYKKDIM